MVAPMATFIYQLMLVMLLLNLTLTFGSSNGTNQLGHLDGFTVAKRVDLVANTEVRDTLKDQYAEHAPLHPDDGGIVPQKLATAIAAAFVEVEHFPTPHTDSTSPTMTVHPYTFSIVTSALPVAPTTLATYGVPGFSDSRWTPFTPVMSTTAEAKIIDTKATTTAPCVTTLATYGSSGLPYLDWTPPAAICPTTLVTIAKTKKP